MVYLCDQVNAVVTVMCEAAECFETVNGGYGFYGRIFRIERRTAVVQDDLRVEDRQVAQVLPTVKSEISDTRQ